MNHYSQEALDVSGSPFILSAPQTAWFASVQWILRDELALGDIDIQRAGGQCQEFRNLHFKIMQEYQGFQSLFLGKYASDKKNPVLVNGSVLPFLETGLDIEVGFSCSSAVTHSYAWVPANPNHWRQAGNFPTSPAQHGVAQGNENGENSLSFLHLSLVAISKGYTCSPRAAQTLPDTSWCIWYKV